MQKSVLEYNLKQVPPVGYGFIYCITSPSGKQYVGQTCHAVAKRVYEHKYGSCSVAISRAIRRYGIAAMQINVLCCAPIARLNDKEMQLIAQLCTQAPNGYNLDSGGDVHRHGRTRAQVTRKRQSEAAKAMWASDRGMQRRREVSKRHRGRVVTAATRAIMRMQHLGTTASKATRQKMRESQRKYWTAYKKKYGKRKFPPRHGQHVSAARRALFNNNNRK